MKRSTITIAALVLALVPAAVGLWGNASFSQAVPVQVPASGQVATSAARMRPARMTTELADDHGGDRPRAQRTEPGDDRSTHSGPATTGTSHLRVRTPKTSSVSATTEDNAGQTPRDQRTETGDDRGATGSDDSTADDSGSRQSGSDDSGPHSRSDDSGSHSSSDDSGSHSGSDDSGSRHGGDD